MQCLNDGGPTSPRPLRAFLETPVFELAITHRTDGEYAGSLADALLAGKLGSAPFF